MPKYKKPQQQKLNTLNKQLKAAGLFISIRDITTQKIVNNAKVHCDNLIERFKSYLNTTNKYKYKLNQLKAVGAERLQESHDDILVLSKSSIIGHKQEIYSNLQDNLLMKDSSKIKEFKSSLQTQVNEIAELLLILNVPKIQITNTLTKNDELQMQIQGYRALAASGELNAVAKEHDIKHWTLQQMVAKCDFKLTQLLWRLYDIKFQYMKEHNESQDSILNNINIDELCTDYGPTKDSYTFNDTTDEFCVKDNNISNLSFIPLIDFYKQEITRCFNNNCARTHDEGFLENINKAIDFVALHHEIVLKSAINAREELTKFLSEIEKYSIKINKFFDALTKEEENRKNKYNIRVDKILDELTQEEANKKNKNKQKRNNVAEQSVINASTIDTEIIKCEDIEENTQKSSEQENKQIVQLKESEIQQNTIIEKFDCNSVTQEETKSDSSKSDESTKDYEKIDNVEQQRVESQAVPTALECIFEDHDDPLILGSYMLGKTKINVRMTKEIFNELEDDSKLKLRFKVTITHGFVTDSECTGIKKLNFKNKASAEYKASNGTIYQLCEVKLLGKAQNGGRVVDNIRLVCLRDASTNIIHGFKITDHKGVSKSVKDFEDNPMGLIDEIIPNVSNTVKQKEEIKQIVNPKQEYAAKQQAKKQSEKNWRGSIIEPNLQNYEEEKKQSENGWGNFTKQHNQQNSFGMSGRK